MFCMESMLDQLQKTVDVDDTLELPKHICIYGLEALELLAKLSADVVSEVHVARINCIQQSGEVFFDKRCELSLVA